MKNSFLPLNCGVHQWILILCRVMDSDEICLQLQKPLHLFLLFSQVKNLCPFSTSAATCTDPLMDGLLNPFVSKDAFT
ncbi:MAG: hypothetical protein IPK31_20630 [Chitinophagaceae bacterium]|nr:hypothetical protein [Chitinophagaceae bacterium]